MKHLKYFEEEQLDKIKKINFTLDEYSNSISDSFANAHKFIYNYFFSGIETRRTMNPHNIKKSTMLAKFGEPNFTTDDDDDYWILEFNNKKYAIDISLHEEGSSMHKIFDTHRGWNEKENDQFSEEAQEFYDEFFKETLYIRDGEKYNL